MSVCLFWTNKDDDDKETNNDLGIKSTAGLKTFMHQVDGHNAFVQPLKFDGLLQ